MDDFLSYPERLSKDEFGIIQAICAAQRSEDPHTQVGACIICKNGDVKIGYNGAASGYRLPNVDRDKKLGFAIHAETNVLSFVRRGDADTIYLTFSPCVPCTLNIVSHGIKRIVYLNEYHRCIEFRETCDYYDVEHYRIDSEKATKIYDIFNKKV